MNVGKAALQILATVAPTIATAAGGPVAGLAVAKLEEFFGVKGDKQLDTAIVGATPDQLAALRKIDNDFKVQMAQIGFEEDQLRFQDTASARAREIAIQDWTPRILAFGVVTTCITLEGAMLLGWNAPSKVTGEVIGRILGTLDAATILVLSYYFGSSAGARRSNDALADIARQP